MNGLIIPQAEKQIAGTICAPYFRSPLGPPAIAKFMLVVLPLGFQRCRLSLHEMMLLSSHIANKRSYHAKRRLTACKLRFRAGIGAEEGYITL